MSFALFFCLLFWWRGAAFTGKLKLGFDHFLQRRKAKSSDQIMTFCKGKIHDRECGPDGEDSCHRGRWLWAKEFHRYEFLLGPLFSYKDKQFYLTFSVCILA